MEIARSKPVVSRGSLASGSIARRLIVGGLLFCAPVGSALAHESAGTDTSSKQEAVVYLNGNIFTAAENGAMATAFVVRDGKFVAVGGQADIQEYLDLGARRVDLEGNFVIPGLGDDHFHGEGGGPGLDLSKVRSIPELLDAVRSAVRVAPADGMVIANFDWHEAQLAEQRLPTAAELDTVAPHTPVILPRGGHSLILNSAALTEFGITTATKSPPGGVISVDGTGRLTGEIIDAAKSLVRMPPPRPMSPDDLIRTQAAMNAFGVTAVRVPGFYTKGPIAEAYRMARELKDAGKLTLRYTFYLPAPGFFGTPADYLTKSALRQDEGDDWVRIGGVKLGVDGGFEGGHLSEPYAEPYGKNGTFSGIVVTPPAQFNEQVTRLAKDGWRVAAHAVGDAAVDQVLDGFEAATATTSLKGRRWTIEHGFIVHPRQIERMKQLDIMLSVQDHLYLAGPSLRKYWGESRANHVTPLRTLMGSGLVVAGGTDAPVVPANPFWAMYHFLSRDTIQGGVMGAGERVTDRGAILRMFTLNYAKMVGEDQVIGSIKPGKSADFVLLSDNFLTAPPNNM